MSSADEAERGLREHIEQITLVSWGELRAMRVSPPAVQMVCCAVLALLGHDKISWADFKANRQLIDELRNFTLNNVQSKHLERARPFVETLPAPEEMVKVSKCASIFAAWARDVCRWKLGEQKD